MIAGAIVFVGGVTGTLVERATIEQVNSRPEPMRTLYVGSYTALKSSEMSLSGLSSCQWARIYLGVAVVGILVVIAAVIFLRARIRAFESR